MREESARRNQRGKIQIMWPFSKPKAATPDHPLVAQFRSKLDSPRAIEWFSNAACGAVSGLPIDVGLQVNDAIQLSYTITSMTGATGHDLARAAKSGDFSRINARLWAGSKALVGHVADNARLYGRIIEWANDHKIPDMTPFHSMVYKQQGVPRNLRDLGALRHLMINEDHGITEIPDEVGSLPLLQAICIDDNRIRTVPRSLYKAISLQRIDLENNLIDTVQDGIDALVHVHSIDLSGNLLRNVTPDIVGMPSLRKLDISGQKTTFDIMRDRDTPLSREGASALFRLVSTIDVKY
ncbi:leucine-rich repeat domain-containing protein [Paracoccus sp. ME4]|uniref:leucine-rich repeat domain-containing protein n=1 Tax=Paracoccus sp. ME4 TaxID=3138066 RepID=UPI00398AD17B